MVQAILQGSKTQTRRIVSESNCTGDKRAYGYKWSDFDLENAQRDNLGGVDYLHLPLPAMGTRHRMYPKWDIGSRLWVRETWQWEGDTKWTDARPIGSFWYKADGHGSSGPSRYKPSIHMPKAAARIWLEVEEVRVERLQDISEADAIAEGVGAGFQMNAGWPDYTRIKNGVCELTQDTAQMSYETLWQSINGPESWEQNPFVWVVKFKRLDR